MCFYQQYACLLRADPGLDLYCMRQHAGQVNMAARAIVLTDKAISLQLIAGTAPPWPSSVNTVSWASCKDAAACLTCSAVTCCICCRMRSASRQENPVTPACRSHGLGKQRIALVNFVRIQTQPGTRQFLLADAMLDDVLQLLTDGGFQFSRLPARRWVAVIVNRASPRPIMS
jgi:hypothetical protein